MCEEINERVTSKAGVQSLTDSILACRSPSRVFNEHRRQNLRGHFLEIAVILCRSKCLVCEKRVYL